MSVFVRAASHADLGGMVALIAADRPVSRHDLADWMDEGSALSAWHVAETEAGEIVGLQRIGPDPALPRDACEIATFLAARRDRLALGSRLFEASAEAARRMGYAWIAARIGARNEGARIFYQSRGFRAAGMAGDKPLMRYDLD